MTRDTIQTTISPSDAPYGYCPLCGALGVSRERRPNGNDKCANGHTYPSRTAVSKPTSNYVDDSDPAKALAEVMDGTPFTPSLASRIASMPRLHTNDYPLWQGPCGEGKLGGITQSMLVRFLSCRERFRLKYVLGLEPPDKWHHTFGYGNMWHVCEEAHAKGDDHLVPLLTHVQEMFKRYPMQQDELTKWWNVCCVQFPEYVQHWQNEPDVRNRTPLLQEQVFDVPYKLPSGRVVRLRGKWDSVDLINGDCNCGADRSGPSAEAHDHTCPAKNGVSTGIYLQENKTKGDIDKSQVERQLKFDLQTMLYLVALEDTPCADYGSEAPIKGVRYNVIRRPLSGGKGNIRPHQAKSTKTKFEPAESEEAFYERLRRDYIAADPNYWFFRIRCEISQQDVKVFRETCLDPLLEELCDWYTYTTGLEFLADSLWTNKTARKPNRLHYRTPFGLWNPLQENGSTEYDAYLSSGSEVGLRRTETLFTELN